MKTRFFKWTLSLLILFMIFQTVDIVRADDHEYKEYEKYYEDHDDDDDREYDDYRGKHNGDDEDEEYEKYDRDDDWQNQPLSNNIQQSLWNIWTRDTSTSQNETLPFQEAKEVQIELNGKSEQLFIVPQNGQLFVSGGKFAKMMEAEIKFYEQSRILEISKGDEELIVHAGSNVAYENMVKTPMPAKALYFEKSVYLPVSVIANSMGYRINWNEEKAILVLQEI